jgi:MoaA/NifB/PqqE/SkfB family radical SAM enzyme
MDWEVYTKIIDQFKEFPEKVKTLRLYKDGEPLMNRNFPAMVKYAKKSGYFQTIDTTTNGRLLNYETSKAIINAGIDKIFISVPKDYDSMYLLRIKNLYKNRGNCHVFAKIAGDFLTDQEKQTFLDYFSPITNSIAIEHTANCWPDYDTKGLNKEVGIYGQPIEKDVLVCPYPFYTLTINSNGTVPCCFVCWNNKVLLGDLAKGDTAYSIWNGDVLKQRRITMLKGLRNTLDFCGKCEHNTVGMPDRIDDYREEILKRLEVSSKELNKTYVGESGANGFPLEAKSGKSGGVI